MKCEIGNMKYLDILPANISSIPLLIIKQLAIVYLYPSILSAKGLKHFYHLISSRDRSVQALLPGR